jgi:hypothetical protein
MARARRHGARRYAPSGAASTDNRQDVLETNDGRVRRILEVRRVDEAKLAQPTVH